MRKKRFLFLVILIALCVFYVSNVAMASSPSQILSQLQNQSFGNVGGVSDYSAGINTIFEDNQNTNTTGEFPTMWSLVKGNVESSMYQKQAVISFRKNNSEIRPIINDSNQYLPEGFTLEFDYFMGDKTQQHYYIGFWNTSGQDNALRMTIIGREVRVNYKNAKGALTYGGPGWKHISLSYRDGTMKIYENGQQVLIVPDIPAQLGGFSIEGGRNNPQDNRAFIRNIRLAGF